MQETMTAGPALDAAARRRWVSERVRRRLEGLDERQAAREAARERMRPYFRQYAAALRGQAEFPYRTAPRPTSTPGERPVTIRSGR